MVSAASSSMARGAAPVQPVALTTSFSPSKSRFFVMTIAPFRRSVGGKAPFYVAETSPGTCIPGENMLYYNSQR